MSYVTSLETLLHARHYSLSCTELLSPVSAASLSDKHYS